MVHNCNEIEDSKGKNEIPVAFRLLGILHACRGISTRAEIKRIAQFTLKYV